MAHTYVANYHHAVWSTKHREASITEDVRERLWSYIGGVAREHKMRLIEVGGIENHVHLAISIPTTLSIAKAVQSLKGASSKFVNDTFHPRRRFEWQDGYSAFSVSASVLDRVLAYIRRQPEHHKKQAFRDEYVELLRLHDIAFDERFVLD
jgi:putative transposase